MTAAGIEREAAALGDPIGLEAADRIYAAIIPLIRGADLETAFNVLTNHLAGLVAANGIDLHRAIDAFKEAHRVYDRKLRAAEAGERAIREIGR